MIEPITQSLTHAYGMWRYRWQAILIAGIVCLVGWMVVFTLPDKFQSSARVSIDTASVLKPLLQGLTTDYDATNQVTLITRVLLSRPNLKKVATATDMDLRVDTPERMESLLRHLHNNIKITWPVNKRNRGSIIYINISYTDKDAVTAQKVVQVLVDSLVEDILGNSRSDAGDAQKFLVNQIKNYEQQLKFSEQRLAEFKKQNVGLMPGQGGGYYARLQSSIEQLEKNKREYQLARSKRDVLKKQLEGEIPVLGENSRMLAINKRIEEDQARLDTLLLKFTDEHPDVLYLRENIQQLEKRKQRIANQQTTLSEMAVNDDMEINPVYQNVKIALRESEVEVATLSAKYIDQKKYIANLEKMIDTVPEVEARLVSLNRNYDVIRQQYLNLLARLESAKLSDDVRVSNFDIKFQIIEPPIVPFAPIGPNRFLFSSAILGAGFLGGIGLAFLLNIIFSVFLTSKELGNVTGYPVLGRVSLLSTAKQLTHRRFGYASFAAAVTLLLLVYGGVILYQDEGVQLARQLMS